MAETHSLTQAISAIEKMNSDQIAEVGKVLSISNLSFIICQDLLEKLQKLETSGKPFNYDAKQIADIIRSLVYLRNNLGRAAFVKEDLKNTLPKLLEFNEINFKHLSLNENTYQNLIELFSDGIEPVRQWHQTGLIDVVLDFDSFIDIRPVFLESETQYKDDRINENKEYKIEELISLIIFRVGVSKDFGSTKSYVFQMTETDFLALESEVARIRTRLELTQNLITKMSPVKK